MEWDPSRFFHPSGSPSPYALLVLHQPVNERAFEVLGEHASFIICADGGSNRFYDMMKACGKESTELPNCIVGDLDSVRPAVRKHYEDLGVSVREDPDQYSTDFTKCLKYLDEHATEIIASPRKQARQILPENKKPSHPSPLDVVILGGLGGRVDQAFSQIHHLYMMIQSQPKLHEATDEDTKVIQGRIASQRPKKSSIGNLYLVSEESVTFVLQKGKNTIHTPGTKRADIEYSYTKDSQSVAGESPQKRKRDDEEPQFFFEQNVGIIPLAGPASITTQGLEWDVKNWRTEIGGQLSTSNHIRADKVEVDSSDPVVFTVELAERFKRR